MASLFIFRSQMQYSVILEHGQIYVESSSRWTMRFLTVNFQVMYGGRAIDNFDRRILNTYMDEYMGDFIFDTFQPFHFFVNEEVDYRIPDEGPRDNYIGELINPVGFN